MADQPHRVLQHRPALDGLRAIAVVLVLIYHLNASWAPGGWLGVDLFFVLSGFLITSLLMAERARWGSISVLSFWFGRARRLLPALVTTLVATLIGAAFLAPPGRLADIGRDVISAMLYVANWRFLLSDEAYFSSVALPSPVRHTWSLAIEEQYYLVFPLLLIGLCALVRSPRTRAVVLLCLALLSAWWMAHLHQPGIEPSRVYYGTDTRIFELLVGSAAGVAWGTGLFRRVRAHPGVQRRSALLAWPAIGLIVAAGVTVPSSAVLNFQGGLLVLALAALPPILCAASPTTSSFQRAFSWGPLVWLGRISYPLYLWHWPVIVFLTPQIVPLPPIALAGLQAGLAIGLAWLTYRYIEQPIRRSGFGALIWRRPTLSVAVVSATVPAVIAGALLLPQTGAALPTVTEATRNSVDLLPKPYVIEEPKKTIVLTGNSIPASLYEAVEQERYPDLVLRDVVDLGCDPFEGELFVGEEQRPTEKCLKWRRDWPAAIRRSEPDLVVYFLPQNMVGDYRRDGRVSPLRSAGHDRFIQDTLAGIRATTRKAGADLAIVTATCHQVVHFGTDALVERGNDLSATAHVNQVAKRWARSTGTGVIDLNKALCTGGYHSEVNDVPLYSDGLHFTKASGPIVWEWMAPQLKAFLRGKP